MDPSGKRATYYMSDTHVVPEGTALLSPEAMGTFDENGDYLPRSVTEDDLGGASLEDAMAGTIVEFEDGDLVEGTVVKIDRDEVLLDIGFKSEGVIPVRELSIRNDVDPSEIVTLGEAIEALVLQKEDKEGRLILSKKRAQYERAWGTIEKLKEADEVVTGPVIEVVKGGLIVDIGLRGFLPASLVELRRVRELQPYVGRTIEAKIIELDRNRNNVVLSRRAWLEETQKEQRGEFLVNLKPGERRRGVVSSVVNFGAFVDLGGMDGLVHVSELSWKHVDHPSSVVSVGDEIDVEVLDVDLPKERISLSLKATQTDPWQEFANSHQVGELVYGRITKLVPFGSFVQVGDGIEGLVHISEMAGHHVDLPEQVVTPGEELWVKIIDIDLQRRRISLSIKQAAEGGEVSEEYREAFGEHAYDAEGNYVGPVRVRRGRVHPRDRGPGGLGRLRGRARHRRRCSRGAGCTAPPRRGGCPASRGGSPRPRHQPRRGRTSPGRPSSRPPPPQPTPHPNRRRPRRWKRRPMSVPRPPPRPADREAVSRRVRPLVDRLWSRSGTGGLGGRRLGGGSGLDQRESGRPPGGRGRSRAAGAPLRRRGPGRRGSGCGTGSPTAG